MTWGALPFRPSSGRSERRSGAPRASSTASVPRVRTAGSGSTRARWPESGHHPTTRPGTSPPRTRNASTRVTRASSARTEPRRGPDSTTGARSPSARRRARGAPGAPNGGCPTSGRGRRPAPTGTTTSRRHTTGGWPRSPPPHRRRPAAGERPSTQRSSCVAEELPSCTQREDSAIRQRTASKGERVVPASNRRTAANPIDRRAVSADQAKGWAGPKSGGGAGERGAHLVVGDAEADGPGPSHGQAGQLRLRLFEGGAPGGGVDRGDGRERARP